MGALVAVVHQVLVGPFEIEGIDEGFAQAAVLELFSPGVEEPALRTRGRIVGEDIALDAAFAHRRKVVTRRPDAGGEFFAEEIGLAGEALEGDVAIAVELVAHHVEIVLPAPDRQIGTPPVLDSVVFDEAAGLETADLVGTAAKRRLQRGLVEGMRGVVRARENRQRGRKQRDVARAVRRKVDEHGGVVGRLGVADIAQQLLGDRVALLLEDFEREGGVMGGERAPVVEGDAGPHQKPVGQSVRGNAHGARSKAVERIRLVGGARHQAAKGELHALRAVALEDEDIE